MRYFWITLGWTCVGLGIAGTFLPLLPTTPFLLLAAMAFSRGSRKWHNWLLEHPHFGPPIHDWHNHGAVSNRVKVVASLSMVAFFTLSLLLQVADWLLVAQGVILTLVAIFLWTRRNPPE